MKRENFRPKYAGPNYFYARVYWRMRVRIFVAVFINLAPRLKNQNPIKPESLENSSPKVRNYFKNGPFYALHLFKFIISSTQKPNPVRIFTNPNAKISKSFNPAKPKSEVN